ncbi:MAG: hypothetical protein IPL53_03990 [Ignavibacteria bacterium]|nr:hypothetical protein [Ignavibacteria bacterium]
MNAERLNSNIYPSPSGNTDSLIINIGELTNYFNNDTVYFSIKAEDAYQNRSVIGNCASYKYIYSATELRAVKNDIYKIGLNWTGVEPGFRKINGEQIDAASFFHYRLFRKTDTSAFVQISDTISQLSYTDNLFNNPDGEYKYCMQAIYDIGASDTVFQTQWIWIVFLK